MRKLFLAFIFLSAIPAKGQMLVDSGPLLHRIVHRNTFAVRYNPIGLLYDGRWVYRRRLFESESVALRDNFWGIGIAPTASPAFVRAGPYVEFQPATIWGLWAAFQYVQYFGSFNLVQGFSGAQAEFSDATIARSGATAAQAASGWELTLGSQFNLKVKDVVIRNATRLVRGSLNLRDGGRVYYDQFYDVLAPNNGWFFTNDLDVLYQTASNRLVVGARYTATLPFYNDAQHLDSTLSTPFNNNMHRVGPFLGYTFFSKDGERFNNPTVFLLIQWWAEHRYRTGLETSSFLPLMAVGFQTTGDFLPVGGPR